MSATGRRPTMRLRWSSRCCGRTPRATWPAWIWYRRGSSAPSRRRPPPCASCRWRPPRARREGPRDYILAPSADAILEQLLPLYVRNAVYRGLVETAAAEHGARRTAMKNATDNAGEILELLKRTYNRQRQAQITQEIAEIVGGAAALQG